MTTTEGVWDKARRLFPEVEEGTPIDVWLPIVLDNYDELLECFDELQEDYRSLQNQLHAMEDEYLGDM